MPDIESLISPDQVAVAERAPNSLRLLATWPDRLVDFADRLKGRLGIARLPGQGEIIDAGGGELMRLAAGRYLLLDADLSLEMALADTGTAVDWGEARQIFDIDGEGAVDLLRRGVGVDLHMASFPAGQLRQTPIGQIDTIILRRAETNFDILVSSSLVESFRHWLAHFEVG